jgi:FkbM family methyltransferase
MRLCQWQLRFGDRMTLHISVNADWLNSITAVERQLVLESLVQIAAMKGLVVHGSSVAGEAIAAAPGATCLEAFPLADRACAWIEIGGTPSGRNDVIPLHVGGHRNDHDTAWVNDAAALVHLATTKEQGGLARALLDRTADDHKAAIMALHGDALSRLSQTGSAYVFGAKRLGTDVGRGLMSMGYSVAGYLDNNPAAWGRHADGASITGVNESLDRTLPVIIGTTRFPYTLTRQLKHSGFSLVIPYPVMTLLDPSRFPAEIPYIGTLEDAARSRSKYLTEYLNYADDRSRDVLDALLLYRLTLDSSCLQGHFEAESEQYFDRDLVMLGPSDVFVDAGGFDGATTLNFLRRAGSDTAQVYYFEPDPALMMRSRETLAGKPNVDFHQAGAFSHDGDATFSSTGTTNGSFNGAAGAVDEGMKVAVKRIDSIVTRPPTMIKMDIEGAEFEALRGASSEIAAHGPLLAIAAYHEGADIWRLAEHIRALNPAYRLGLRHYTEGGLETVLYAFTDLGLRKARAARQQRGQNA